MSYCVNCGVELAASEKCCPLCSVVVMNPAKPWVEPQYRPYPNRVDKVIKQVNRRYWVGLASLILLIPALVTLVTNIFASGRITWSAYVTGACFLILVIVLLPILFKKPRPFLFVACDAAAILAFLAMIDLFTGSYFSWFIPLALPIVALTAALAVFSIVLIRNKKSAYLNKVGLILFALAVLCVAIEIVINAFVGISLAPVNWSLYAALPCIVLGVIMFYTERHHNLKESIRKRLFINYK